MVEPEKSDKNFDPLSSRFDKLNLLEERDKDKLRSWLGKILRVVITDGRCVVGRFICTDRDGNTILENTWEYTDPVNGKLKFNNNQALNL